MQYKKHSSGFTLIEILIVVALLGALVVGLLATLDPFQQVKKGADTATRNMAADIYRSFVSYQAVKGQFPWTSDDITGLAASANAVTEGSTGYITQVISAGELKTEFVNTVGATNLGKIFLTSTAVSGVRNNLSVCFMPESKTFRADTNARYGVNGEVSSGCAATGGATACYWCAK